MRVLVIEDEVDLRSAVAQAFREEGYAVDEAEDGREGLFKASGADYDAIVLDLMMPMFTPTLTRMSLLSFGYDTQYVDYLCSMDRLRPPQRRAFTFYTALACGVFLSELGQRFNCEQTPQVALAEIARLQSIFESLIDELR
jgi:CheY-like chemotaxis protein